MFSNWSDRIELHKGFKGRFPEFFSGGAAGKYGVQVGAHYVLPKPSLVVEGSIMG